MVKHMQFLAGPSLAAAATEESFVDLVPRERLVYVTPLARQTLDKFDCDDVYLIGGDVDMDGTKLDLACATLNKSRQLGICTAKLPLDKYLKWERGHKRLPLNIILEILLDVYQSKDWKTALLRNVPQWKLTVAVWNKVAEPLSLKRKQREQRTDWLVMQLHR